MEDNNVQNKSLDLLNRMEQMETSRPNTQKLIAEEYAKGKPSPQFYKTKALEKLKQKVTKFSNWEQFKQYIGTNTHDFSDNEMAEIKGIVDNMKRDKEYFNQWRDNNIKPLHQKES